MIPDQGTLGDTAPAKLLLHLYEQKQTGILYFRQNEVLKVFYLNRGKISWAISSDEADKIEHILLAKKMVSPELLAPYQAGNKIAETFGKALVENGMLSLEGLINATREQVRNIATSVLRWSSGNYQLVQESPPTRLVSLDLEIPGLVSGYVLAQMDVNIVWEELGSLSGELEQTTLTEKKNLYPMDVEQQEVFSRFDQPQRLESVLLDFPAERKYRILKILYFFLLTGLLRKKEADKAPSLNFNELDSLFGQDAPSGQAEVDIKMPDIINDAEIKDIPLSEFPKLTVRSEAEAGVPELPEFTDLMPPEIPETREEIEEPRVAAAPEKAPVRIQPLLRPEKPKPRWKSITFLSVLLAAVVIGLFLWLTRTPEMPGPSPLTQSAPRAQTRKAPPRRAVAAARTTQNPADEAEPTAAAVSAPAGEKKPAPADNPPPAGVKPVAPDILPAATGAAAASQAEHRFTAGNFSAAAGIWREELLAAQIKFSILLEMDCLKASVRIAYRQIEDKGNFFLLNKTSRDGRRCWLVLWGKYRTADEAALGMKLIPQYFWKQSEPPSVIELEPYL